MYVYIHTIYIPVVSVHTKTVKKNLTLQGQFRTHSGIEQSEFIKLECGCMINDRSGELYQKCISHVRANFTQ